jgi:hypothetical protein
MESRVPAGNRYHFTVNDVKSEVFARDLVFFVLLDRLARELPSPGTKPLKLSKAAWKLLTTIYYT